MHKFSEFDLKLNIARLPLTYSLGDLSSIREIFMSEHGDIGRTQLPILPPKAETLDRQGSPNTGYLVETSPALLVAIKEFLKSIVTMLEHRDQYGNQRDRSTAQYVETRRECMNRIGVRLVEVIKQERRLGLYNLFWLVISKHLASLLPQAIPSEGDKYAQATVAVQPIIAQALQETLQKVRLYLHKKDEKARRYSAYIHETITSHLGTTFNYEFSRAIITDQIHLLYPNIAAPPGNLLECAKAVFVSNNEKYQISYTDFVEIYAGVRSYIEGRLRKNDPIFREMTANILRIPAQTVDNVPIESILLHPTIISLFAEEIKQLPVKSASRRKTFFIGWSEQLGNILGEGAWEFAINDYLTFAKDLRRSEIIAFLRDQIVFVMQSRQHQTPIQGIRHRGSRPSSSIGSGITDKISYQFEKGRIIHDLRSVTLIFLDLRGFTELSAGDITDQELIESLYNFFDPVVNIINHFEGTVKNYAGDGILAAFGTDSRHKNHALNAVRAALEIQKFFQTLKQDGKMVFQGMGIGIHTGLVEEAYFFSDLESPSYNTVIGLAANLVGRMSSGKADKKNKFDLQAALAVHESLKSRPDLDMAVLDSVENQLLQALEAIEDKKLEQLAQQRHSPQLAVTVNQGILNNQGVAISGVEHGTFERIRASVKLKKIEAKNKVHYAYFDPVLHEQLVFIKAGEASFKGIDTGTAGKFPVWGVYLERNLPFALL
jgi:class 3 adenylate cyclase